MSRILLVIVTLGVLAPGSIMVLVKDDAVPFDFLYPFIRRLDASD